MREAIKSNKMKERTNPRRFTRDKGCDFRFVYVGSPSPDLLGCSTGKRHQYLKMYIMSVGFESAKWIRSRFRKLAVATKIDPADLFRFLCKLYSTCVSVSCSRERKPFQ